MKLNGRKLKHARELKGLLQEQLAVIVKVSTATINRAENGGGILPPTAAQICKVLDVRLEDLAVEEFVDGNDAA